MNDLELHPSFIEREGKREYAVLPYEEFERLQEFIEDAQDLFAIRQAKAEDDGEYLTLAEVEARLKNLPKE
jgi:hypothetical protein